MQTRLESVCWLHWKVHVATEYFNLSAPNVEVQKRDLTVTICVVTDQNFYVWEQEREQRKVAFRVSSLKERNWVDRNRR